MVVTVDGLVPLYPLQRQNTVSLQLQVPSGRTLDRILFTINVLMTDGPVLNAKKKEEQPDAAAARPTTSGNGGGGGSSSGGNAGKNGGAVVGTSKPRSSGKKP